MVTRLRRNTGHLGPFPLANVDREWSRDSGGTWASWSLSVRQRSKEWFLDARGKRSLLICFGSPAQIGNGLQTPAEESVPRSLLSALIVGAPSMSEELRLRLEQRLASPSLTPMMRQYLSVKMEHPTALVFFRMGDFFETFFEDAEECAQRLDIALTARSKERDIPMAGVPHHALDAYLGRLVEQQRTVVLVDQVEDPKQSKGLVRREITRIITPGTFIDPSGVPGARNYLVALELGEKKRAVIHWGLAALDVATGDFRATNGVGAEALVDEVLRLQAREVLVVQNNCQHPSIRALHEAQAGLLITPLDEKDHGKVSSLANLNKHLGPADVDALRELLAEAALVAAGRAIAYARLTQVRKEAPDVSSPASLGHILELRPYVPGEALIIDREARVHLELFVSSGGTRKGSLLGAIDKTITPMGARLLSDWLAYPSRDLKKVAERHHAVESIRASLGDLESLRGCLGAVADTDRLVGRIMLGRALAKDLVQLARSLQAAPDVLSKVQVIAERFGSERLRVLSGTDDCKDIAQWLVEALLDEPANSPLTGPIFREGFDAELDRYSELAAKGKALMEELEQRERHDTKIPSLKVKYNKVFGYFIEVTKSNLALVPDRFIRKQTTVNAERYFTEELKELEDELLHAEERRAQRTEEKLTGLIVQVGAEVARLKALSATFAEVDVFQGLAFLARSGDWVRPEMHAGLDIDIQDGRHPVLDALVGVLGERFVPNDVLLSEGERLLIVTGPNMAGKSTIMRQTALITILAYLGSLVPAKKARLGRVDRVFTRVGASDDLSRGRSTFMVEMTEASRILRSATEYDLIILDEIGRGTSTFDGLAIAWAIAEYIHDKVQARTMFATHYHELTELATQKDGVVNYHVAVREHKNDIVFLRKLLPGATNRSYGVQVARLAGLPATVVSRARGLLQDLESQSLHTRGGFVRQLTMDFAEGGQQDDLEVSHDSYATEDDDQGGADVFGDTHIAEVVARLRSLDLDDLSPRKAFAVLGELQATLQDG